jgi:hypothetical protein
MGGQLDDRKPHFDFADGETDRTMFVSCKSSSNKGEARSLSMALFRISSSQDERRASTDVARTSFAFISKNEGERSESERAALSEYRANVGRP